MTFNDLQLITYDLKSRWDSNRSEVLTGIDTPYWDNEQYQWFVDQLDHVYMLDDDECIEILHSLGYNRKLILKTYGVWI